MCAVRPTIYIDALPTPAITAEAHVYASQVVDLINNYGVNDVLGAENRVFDVCDAAPRRKGAPFKIDHAAVLRCAKKVSR